MLYFTFCTALSYDATQAVYLRKSSSRRDFSPLTSSRLSWVIWWQKITQLCQKTQMLKSKFLRSISMETTRQNIYGDKAAPAIQAVNREGKVHHGGSAREDHGRATLTFKSPSSFLLTFSTSARAFFSLSQCSFVCNTKNNNAYELRSNKQKNASTK